MMSGMNGLNMRNVRTKSVCPALLLLLLPPLSSLLFLPRSSSDRNTALSSAICAFNLRA